MRTILAAVAFLTRLPVARTGDAPGWFGAAAFGLVGAGLGAVAAIPVLLAGERAPLVAAPLAVALLAIGSGGLHLDGLADTADALVAPAGERAERARKDPAIGAAGAVALILVLGLDAAAIAGLAAGDPVASPPAATAAAASVVVAASWGRAVAVIVALAGRTGPGQGGLGAGFVGAVRGRDALLAAAVPSALVAAIGVTVSDVGLALAIIGGAAVGLVVALSVTRLRGGVDGDGLGASVELAQAATLVVTALTLALAGTGSA